MLSGPPFRRQPADFQGAGQFTTCSRQRRKQEGQLDLQKNDRNFRARINDLAVRSSPHAAPRFLGLAVELFSLSRVICSAFPIVGQDRRNLFFAQRSPNYAGHIAVYLSSKPTWNIHVSSVCPTSEVPEFQSETRSLGEMRGDKNSVSVIDLRCLSIACPTFQVLCVGQ